MNRTILHIDINSYFATLLQQENPKLRGKPIGVVKDEGRTCIIAASKEAKKFGVATGSILAQALQRCPDLQTVPAQFEFYLSATRQLKQLFSQVAPNYFVYSLDEVFIDISDCRHYLYPDPKSLGQHIQYQIKQTLGEWVTCNVGIADSRLMAKIASEIGPKGSVTVVDDTNRDLILSSAEFHEVCGVGFKLEQKLNAIGVTNPYQIRFVPDQDLQQLVGEHWTQELKKIAYGQETHLLSTQIDQAPPQMKSVSRSITGFQLLKNEQAIKAVLYNLTEEITFKARKMGLAGRQISVAAYGSERRQRWGRFITLPHFVSHTTEIFEVLYHQLYCSWQRSFPIIKLMVRLSLLKPHYQVGLLLFDHQRHQVTQATDAINEKYGLFTVKAGTLLKHRTIKPEVTGFLGDRTYYGL